MVNKTFFILFLLLGGFPQPQLRRLVVFCVGLSSVCASSSLWWQTGTIYQIYTPTFADSNNDGWGDLQGVSNHADYFSELNVTAIVLSSILEIVNVTSNATNNVTSYANVNSQFGTIEDLESLIEVLHNRSVKLILEIEPNHTSNESVWFNDSLLGYNNKRDFYVWKDPQKIDPKADPPIVPPNNWTSILGGSAWTYMEETGQYYLHQFDVTRPDLNLSNSKVVEEIKIGLEYLLDLGVDGFQISAASFLLETFNGTDTDEPYLTDCRDTNSYDCYDHVFTRDQQGTFDLLAEFEELLVNKSTNGSERVMFLSTNSSNVTETIKYYGTNMMPYNFQLVHYLELDSNASHAIEVLNTWMNNSNGNWPNWVIGSSDYSRVATRMGEGMIDAMNMIALLLPGTPVTYYGEEIGMTDTVVSDSLKRDNLNRDPFRTPMQWSGDANAGFSTNTSALFLPVNQNYLTINAATETVATPSHLEVYTKIRQRIVDDPTDSLDSFKTYELSNWTFAFERDNTLVVVNLNSLPENLTLRDTIDSIPDTVTLKVQSLNSQFDDEDSIDSSSEITLYPRSAIVLDTSGALSISLSPIIVVLTIIHAIIVHLV